MTMWIVFELLAPSMGNRKGWAWCRPFVDTAGFEEIAATTTTGMPMDLPDDFALGDVVFTVAGAAAEPASQRVVD